MGDTENVDLKDKILEMAELAAAATSTLQIANESLTELLGPAVGTWHEIDPVPCHPDSQWWLARVDGEWVDLVHECVFVHRTTDPQVHRTRVRLGPLLGAAHL